MNLSVNKAPRKETACLRALAIAAIYLLFFSTIQGQRPSLTLPVGHQQLITTVDFSRDGKLIATGTLDNTFILWDARTNFMIRRIKAAGPVQQVLFTPNGSQLIVVTGQSEAIYASVKRPVLQLWDVKTGKLVRRLPFTASPGLRYLRSSPALLVPDYSTDTSDKKETAMQRMRRIGEQAEKGDDEASLISKEMQDSLEKVMEARMEELQKNMGKMDLSDPKKMAEYTKKLMEGMMTEGTMMAATYDRNLTILESVHFTRLTSMQDVADNLQILYHNGREYLLKPQQSYTDKGERITAVEVGEIFRSGGNAKKPILPAKTFSVPGTVNHLAASSEKGYFANDAPSKGVQLWQFDRSAPLTSLRPSGSTILNMEFTAHGDTLYVYSSNPPARFIEAWTTDNFRQVFSLKVPQEYLGTNTWLSPSGGYLFTSYGFGLAKVGVQGKEVSLLQGKAGNVGYFGFSGNDREAYVNYGGMPDFTKTMRRTMEMTVESEAKEQHKTLSKAEKDKLVQQKLDQLPKQAMDPRMYRGFLLNWDLVRGGARFQEAGAYSEQHRSTSTDNNYQLVNEQFENAGRDAARDNAVLINDATKNAPSGETAEIRDMFNNPGGLGQYMNRGSINGPVTLLVNRRTKDSISLINIDSTDWIMLLRSGYYMASRNGARALSYTRGLDVIPFEQLDVQYNRPDLVLKAIGKADTALVGAYRNAYRKRIRRLGIDPGQFNDELNVPEADFSNRGQIGAEQTSGKLMLTIQGHDNKTTLDRYNIWVNEVPLFGRNGKSLKEARSGTLNTTAEITLSRGKNRIETSVMNANGIESYRMPLVVEYKPGQAAEEKLYFIGIGIDKFADGSHNLRYCEKDVRDLAQQFKERYGARLESTLLFNEEVTIEKVRALKQRLVQGNENDKIILVYSGHGLLSKSYDYYLSTYSVDFGKPEQNGLPYEELEDLLDGIRARKKLLLIDACHSGEIDKEEVQRIQASQQALAKAGVNPKGIIVPSSGKLGSRNSFELMQELFVNVGRSTGATVISAAAGTQFALEKGDLKNGIFTYAILELLQKGRPVALAELKRYVSKRVAELTDNLQQPTARNEIQSTDWEL